MKLDQKKINKILLVVLVVSLALGLTAMFLTRTVEREPTAEEKAFFDAYRVNLPSDMMVDGASVKAVILVEMCSHEGMQTVNGTQYNAYASDTLLSYLYDGVKLNQILVSQDETLYITYTAQGNLEVMLAYTDTGSVERSVYDVERDILFHEIEGTLRVYEHFSSSR